MNQTTTTSGDTKSFNMIKIDDNKIPTNSLSLPENYNAFKYRKWINLNTNKSTDESVEDDNKITIMTFNLLSRHYVWKQLFGYLDQKYLHWTKYRFPLINETIKQFSTDIMCFQEMEYAIYKQYWSKDFPTEDFKSFFVRKSFWNHECSNKDNESIDGVAIFINSKKFDIIKKKEINFGKLILENSKDYDITFDLYNRLVTKNTVAILLELYDKLNDKTIYISNTHLYWSPEFNDVKVLQTKLLLNEFEKFITDPDPNIILLGDLNSNIHSEVCHLLGDQHINIKDANSCFHNFDYGKNPKLINEQGTIENPFEFTNVYDSVLRTNQLHFTSYIRSLTDVLDHIYISKDKFIVNKILSEVDQKYCSNCEVKGFPNNQFPSDHIPLCTEIRFK